MHPSPLIKLWGIVYTIDLRSLLIVINFRLYISVLWIFIYAKKNKGFYSFWTPLSAGVSGYIENPLEAFSCCLLYGWVVVTLTLSSFPISIIHINTSTSFYKTLVNCLCLFVDFSCIPKFKTRLTTTGPQIAFNNDKSSYSTVSYKRP